MLVAVLVGYVMLAVTAGAERRSPFDSAAFDSDQPMGAERISSKTASTLTPGRPCALAARSAARRNLNTEVGCGDYCLLEAGSLSSPQNGKMLGDEHL